MRTQPISLATGLIFDSVVRAQSTAFNLTSTGCHDVDSYETCTISAAADVETCNDAARAAGSELALLACGCVYYIEMMNCYMASCWNRVYECEYQEYAIQYISECPNNRPTIDLPFFPAPDTAPDSCSCNLGKLYLAVNGSEVEGATCVTKVGQGALSNVNGDPVTIEDEESACVCCGESGAISAYYNICPDTDPSIVGLGRVYSYITEIGNSWDSCSPFMSAYDCTSDLNFTSDVAGGTFFSPDDLPANGTATLSNVAGTVSAPPAGTVFSYTNYYDSNVYTITAAVNGQDAGVVSGTSAAAGTATGTTTTGSAPGATSTSKLGAASTPRGNWKFAAAVALVGAVALP